MIADSLIGTRNHGRTTRVSVLLLSLAALLFASVAPAAEIVGSARLIAEREGHTATLLGKGSVLVVGGRSSSGPIAVAEIYDPTTRTFSVAGTSLQARADHAAVRLADGRVLILGGRGRDQALASTEIYDSKTNTFSAGPSLTHARFGHTATLLADGRVVVIGGDATGCAEIYEPSTGLFKDLEQCLAVPRRLHAAAVLRDGNILVAGGIDANGAPLASAEILNLETLSFSDAPIPMLAARSGLTLRVLPDGKVQVIGGDREATMELFNPAGRYFSSLGHLGQDPAVSSAALRNAGRTALIGSPASSRPALARLSAEGGDLGAAGVDTFDRSGFTVTELAGTNTAVLIGGLASGSLQSRAVLFDASSATVTTDKSDYSPGQTVVITGTGWLPGETVTLNIHRDTNDPPDTVLTAVADANGNISNSEYVVQEYDLGLTFLLTATGQTSGYTAQTTFTDGALKVRSAAWPASASPRTFGVTVQEFIGSNNCSTGAGSTSSGTADTNGFNTGNIGSGDSWKITANLNADSPNTTFVFSNWTTGAPPNNNVTFAAGFSATDRITCIVGFQSGTKDLIGNYVGTVNVTFNATPINAAVDVAGATNVLSVTIGANPAVSVTKAELPKTFAVASGTSVSYSYVSPVASTTATKQYRWSSTSGTGSASTQTAQSGGPFVANATSTVTAVYVAQHQQTFTHSGLAADATGTVVTVDGSPKTLADLPFSKFVDAGATVSYVYADPVTSSVAGKRYALTTPAATPATGYTVSGTNTVTGTYKVQWEVTFAQSGLSADATGTVVTVDGSPKTFAQLSFSKFVDAGATVSYAYSDPVTSSVAGKRYVLTTPAPSPATGFTVSAAVTVTGTYKTQYQLTFNQSGIGGDTTATVLTISTPISTTKTAAQLPFSDWFDASSSVTYSYSDPVASTTAGKRYALTTPAPTPASGFTVSTAVTVTGTYKTQYELTFNQSGIGADTTATVLTITTPISATKTAAQLPYSDWFDAAASVTYSYSDPVASTTAGKRYALTTPAPSPASPISVSACRDDHGHVQGAVAGDVRAERPVGGRSGHGGGRGRFAQGVRGSLVQQVRG